MILCPNVYVFVYLFVLKCIFHFPNKREMKLAFFLPVAWAGDRCWSPDSPYTGTVSKQIGGVPCQSWDRDFPNTVGHYPKDALYSNYCRNPAGFSN